MDNSEDYRLIYETPKLSEEEVRLLLIGCYDYYSQGGFLHIVLNSLFYVLTPLSFISAVYLLIWFVTDFFHTTSFISLIFITTIPLLLWKIIYIRYYYTYKLYYDENNLTGKNWSEIMDDFGKKLEMSEEQINNILYYKLRIIKRIFNMGILRRLWTKIMYWQINTAIIDPMTKGISIDKISTRSKIIGLLYLLLSPVFLVLLLLYGLLKYGASTRYNPGLLQLKDWTYLAKNKLRGHSEPYWDVVERLNQARSLVEQYQNKPYSTLLMITFKFLRLVVASHLGILIFVSINKPELLLLYNYLPWLIFILSTVLTFLQNKISDRTPPADLDKIRTELEQREIDTDNLNYYYQYRIVIFLMEVLSIFITPLLLIFYFPSRLEYINHEVSLLNSSVFLDL